MARKHKEDQGESKHDWRKLLPTTSLVADLQAWLRL